MVYDAEAQLITIYVGRNTEEEKVKLMRAITSEDEELSVDHFEVCENMNIKLNFFPGSKRRGSRQTSIEDLLIRNEINC